MENYLNAIAEQFLNFQYNELTRTFLNLKNVQLNMIEKYPDQHLD